MQLQNLLRNNIRIPTLPEVVMRVNTLLEDDESGTREIGAVVAEDAAIAAKVLRIANSSFYGLRVQCISTEDACAVLGARVLRNVATQAAVVNQFEHLRTLPGFDLDGFWRHAILMAQTCSLLARRVRVRLPLREEELYVCGLLHDLGKVVMLDGLGAAYADLVRRARAEQKPLHVLEARELGMPHTEVGALIAKRWGLPAPVAAAIQFHHGPREQVEADPVVCLVANTNLLVHRVVDDDGAGADAVFDGAACRLLGLELDDVEAMIQHLERVKNDVEV